MTVIAGFVFFNIAEQMFFDLIYLVFCDNIYNIIVYKVKYLSKIIMAARPFLFLFRFKSKDTRVDR